MMKTKTYITVRTDFIGYHRYPDAPDEVAFLRNLHRHKFNVEVKIEVERHDRELEFFMVQRQLIAMINDIMEYVDNECSCETMADRLLSYTQDIYPDHFIHSVSVFEDNENGATVEQVASLP